MFLEVHSIWIACLVGVEVVKVRVQVCLALFVMEVSDSLMVSLVMQCLVVAVRGPPRACTADSILARCSGVSFASISGGIIADMSVMLVIVVSQRPGLTSMGTGSTAQPAKGVKRAIASKIRVFT